MLKVCSINLVSFSWIKLGGNVVKRVEKLYVDTLDARKPLDLNLLRISPEFLIEQNSFLPFLSTNCSAIFFNMVFNRSMSKSPTYRQLNLIKTKLDTVTFRIFDAQLTVNISI